MNLSGITVTQLVLCCVVVCAMTAVVLGVLYLFHRMFQSLAAVNQEQRKSIESLTKLAAAKDVAAFHALEATSIEMPNLGVPHVALDDESIARAMMQRYAEQGIDPNFALSPDSDPLEEFGGRDAFP